MQSNELTRISKQAIWVALSAIAVVLAAPPTAYGDISLLYAGANADGIGIDGPGTITCDECVIYPNLGMPYAEPISTTLTIAYNGITSSSVTGNGSGGRYFSDSGYAFLDYYFEVEGSAPGVTAVPVLVNYSLLSDATAGAASSGASATLKIGGTVDISVCAAEPLPPGINCSYGSDNLIDQTSTYYATPGSEVLIQMIINGSATGTWAATVDPSLEIDPSFAAAADFSLEASPIPQSSTVPEPSYSWLLSTALLALLGAGRYKRLRTKPDVVVAPF